MPCLTRATTRHFGATRKMLSVLPVVCTSWWTSRPRLEAANAEDCPVAYAFVESNMYVHGIWPPNDETLIRQFADAIGKVLSQPEELMKVEVPGG